MRRRTLVLALGAAGLFVLAAWLRLRDFDAIPIHRDWAWFLRSAGAHAVGEEPASNHAFLYTSVPVVIFGKILGAVGLQAALVLWGGLAALAAPLTAAAVAQRLEGRLGLLAAAMAGVVVAISPTDIAFGRGLESPYLATALVASGAIGLGALGKRWGGPLLVASWTFAAGMHIGLVGLASFAVLIVLWHAARVRERDGVAAGLQSLVFGWVAAFPVVWILLRFDVSRFLSNLVLLTQGAGEGYAGEPTTLEKVAETFALHGVVVVALVLLVILGLRGSRGDRPEAASVSLVWLALAAGLAPFALGFLRTGYLSADHSAVLLPLLLAGVVATTGARATWAAGVWLIAALVFQIQAPARDQGTDLAVVLAVADAMRGAADAVDREPTLITSRRLERESPQAFSADVLGEVARVIRPPRRAGPQACVVAMHARRQAPLGLTRVASAPMRARGADLFLDPDCSLIRERLGLLCALEPAGFFERTWPQQAEPRNPFGSIPDSCIAPVGMTAPALAK
jgi:hypothetical protein